VREYCRQANNGLDVYIPIIQSVLTGIVVHLSFLPLFSSNDWLETDVMTSIATPQKNSKQKYLGMITLTIVISFITRRFCSYPQSRFSFQKNLSHHNSPTTVFRHRKVRSRVHNASREVDRRARLSTAETQEPHPSSFVAFVPIQYSHYLYLRKLTPRWVQMKREEVSRRVTST